MDRNLLYLTHVLFSAPIFIYIGHFPVIDNKYIGWLILALGIIITLYHLGKFIQISVSYGYNNWINLIHALVMGPILIYAGWKKELPYPWAQISLVLGYGAMVNFILNLYKSNFFKKF